MAEVTGTLILRPVASRGSYASTVPADTPEEEIYKLVNEEAADNGTTNFGCQYTSGSYYVSNAKLRLKYSIPQNIKVTAVSNITSVVYVDGTTINVCICTYTGESSLNGTTSTYWRLTGDSGSYWSGSKDKSGFDESDNWETLSGAILEALNNDDFALGYSTGNSKGVYVTQAYIKLDCTYEEAGTPLYFKQNGAWEELSGTVYQKANGVWAEADVSALAETEYPIEEVS